MINLITHVGLMATLLAALIWIIKVIIDKRNTATIINYLRESKSGSNIQFLPSYAIASETNLSEKYIHKLCKRSEKIMRGKR